jgi:hypothetical protein
MRFASRQSRLFKLLGGLILCGSCLLSSGCALGELGKNIADSTAKMFRPTSRDYFDQSEVGTDEWAQAGEEGRGDQSREHESDGLTKYMSSPKAQSIERNLGFD